MSRQFHVTVGAEWTFEVDTASLVSSVDGPNGTSRGDSVALLRNALAAPIDFPSLESAIVPGDRIAVAVDLLLPDPTASVQGVLEGLEQAGADLDLVTLVLPASLAHLSGEWGHSKARVAVHDPADRRELAYLAATSAGRPIYLNRLLCDADLLIPVTCVPPPSSPRWRGIHGSVYPTFSDCEGMEHHRASLGRLTAAQHELRCREVDEVGWLLGANIVVGVVPGRNGTIVEAVAGTPQRVREHCSGIAREGWQRKLPRRVPLVITLVGERNGELLWDDFAAALAAARQAVGDNGAVAVCGNFTRRPGRSLSRLLDPSDLSRVGQRLHNDQHEDTWAAEELAVALERGPVFFAGGLSDEQVESLGMAPIQRPEELARLASRFDECVVINDADIAAPYVSEEARTAP